MEKKLHSKIARMLKSDDTFVYHIKDVPHTGARICDFLVCKEGKLLALEAKVVKRNRENFENNIDEIIEKRLTPSQQAYRYKLLKAGAKYKVYAFVYSQQDVDIEHTKGTLYIVRYYLENDTVKSQLQGKMPFRL
jgi:hypothetical protein